MSIYKATVTATENFGDTSTEDFVFFLDATDEDEAYDKVTGLERVYLLDTVVAIQIKAMG